MQDVVLVDGRARGIIAKNLVTGKLERFAAHAVVIGTGGYGNTYFCLLTLWVVTVQLLSLATARVPYSQTRHTFRFTRLVFRYTVTSSLS